MDKGQILIVDDEESIISSLEGILEDEGYRTLKATSGKTALDLVRSESPDVVLVDVWMPGIDGIKTLQAVKNMHPEIEVVVMSGHGTIETAVAATKLVDSQVPSSRNAKRDRFIVSNVGHAARL